MRTLAPAGVTMKRGSRFEFVDGALLAARNTLPARPGRALDATQSELSGARARHIKAVARLVRCISGTVDSASEW